MKRQEAERDQNEGAFTVLLRELLVHRRVLAVLRYLEHANHFVQQDAPVLVNLLLNAPALGLDPTKSVGVTVEEGA